MSAEIPAPVPTVSASTLSAPSGARFADQGSGLSVKVVWVRQPHTPLYPKGVSNRCMETNRASLLCIR